MEKVPVFPINSHKPYPMKAAVFNKKATPDKIIISEIQKPMPGDDEVLVKVRAVSLNAADYRSMQLGIIPAGKIFGADIAGTVESAGKRVTRFKPGDEVTGDLADSGFGGLASYVAAPERLLAIKPDNLSFEEAACLPLAGVTALQALRMGNIRAGHQVLIIGSSGGVGIFAVQLAKHFGAEVTAVCSTRNVEQSLKLGAAEVVDYTREDFTKGENKYDIILAVNGNYSLLDCKRMLKPGGIYVLAGGALVQIFKVMLTGWLLSAGTRKVKFLRAKPDRNDLEYLSKLASDGNLIPVIDRFFPFHETAAAFRYVSEGHATGKVVILVGED
jgi:NADPH:quinone reductase-like Zn-dependent oxidoreductase